jgi:putative DNA primase/helicase
MQSTHEVDRAREALNAIPPNLAREEWVRAGMAAQAAGLSFDEFREWSAQAESFNERDALTTWRSFKPGKGIGVGTLYKLAAQNGWRPDAGRHARRADRAERPMTRVRSPGQGMGASEVWARCKPADSAHPYIRRKNGVPDGLRVVSEADPLHVAGEAMAGALAVPVYRPNGTISTIQFITAGDTAARLKAAGKPDKLNLPGSTFEDGWFTVGISERAGTVYLCEGIGQAWAVWEATGKAAVVTFGWGRMLTVADQLRQGDAAARLVLVPDAGKEADAEAIAREVRGELVTMPAGSPRNTDVNDLVQRDGIEALELLLSKPVKPAQRYRLLGADDLAALPHLPWCVRGVLPREGLASVYGPSGSGKTFLTWDLAAAIAEGSPWFGCRTEAAPVVYVALEGEAGMKMRAKAWVMHRGRPLPQSLRLVLQPFKLTEPQDVADLAASVPPGAVVFLDTLNRAAPTSDENSSRDMGEILEAAKRLQSLTQGLIVLVHHTGKDAAKGMRGHSSLFAAIDAGIEVSRGGERREWRLAKSKDGADGNAHSFRLQQEVLGTDADGEAISSCVVVPDLAGGEVQRVRLPRGINQRIALDVLRPMFKEGELGKPGVPPTIRSIDLEQAISAVAARMTCESHRRTQRAREAVTGLHGGGVVALHDGRLWQCT